MVLPTLMAREMRSAARQPFTYYLRMMGVATLLVVLSLLFVEGRGEMGKGGELFAHLHATLLATIWVMVPLLTADCISRERREQTLPILFLTPLTPRHIVVAKGLAHVFRALSLWLAVMPVLAIPFIVGGVSWQEAVLSILLNFGSICLATAAGLLASASSRLPMRALVLAASLGFFFFFVFALQLGYLVAGGGVALPFAFGKPDGLGALFGLGLDVALDNGAGWRNLLGVTLQHSLFRAGYAVPNAPLGTNLPLLLNFGIVALSCFAALVLLIKLAAWNLCRAWREEPPSERVVRIRQRLCSPVYFKPVFQRWMRWELNHNPIGWLEQRTWSGRLITWSWLAVFICIYSSLLANIWLYQRAFQAIQGLLAWLLVASIAISSSRSFHRERESGFLELLLISPLSASQIIGGRVRGLWAQFMPATFLFVSLWLYFDTFIPHVNNDLTTVIFYGVTFITLPVIGLYESLARTNFIAAFLSTLFLGAFLPSLIARLGDFFNFVLWTFGVVPAMFQTDTDSSLAALPFQCLIAGGCAWRLHRNLQHRRFALKRQMI